MDWRKSSFSGNSGDCVEVRQDLAALRTQPPFAASAMDGYAVRAADAGQAPVTLKLSGAQRRSHR